MDVVNAIGHGWATNSMNVGLVALRNVRNIRRTRGGEDY